MKLNVALICLLFTALTAEAAKLNETQVFSDSGDRIVVILSQVTGLPESEITEDKSFVRDLKMDHTAHEAFRQALSEDLNRTVTVEDAEKITTVRRARNFHFLRTR